MTRRSSPRRTPVWACPTGRVHGRTVASAPPCWTMSSPSSSPRTDGRSRRRCSSARRSRNGSRSTCSSGDVSFETSYSLPGEQRPARIRVDTSFDWPTWSQTAYRSWSIGEDPDELPELSGGDRLPGPGPRRRARASPAARGPSAPTSPSSAQRSLDRGPPPSSRCSPTTPNPEFAVEVSYEGSCPLDESILEDSDQLDEALAPLGRSVASVLVRIGDLPFAFRPPAPADPS